MILIIINVSVLYDQLINLFNHHIYDTKRQTHKFNLKHALSSHLHMYFTVSSHSKLIITVMSFSSVNIMSSSENACPAVTQSAKLCLKSNILLQFEMRILMIKLNNLLFLESVKFYHSS